MDVVSMDAANALVGNDPGAATLEWALGGGAIRFDRACRFALTGATADAAIDGQRVGGNAAHGAVAGAVLTIGRFSAGRFLYVAISGGIDVPVVLGSRSTYVPARLGGHEGRLIRTGDRLPIGESGRHVQTRASAAPPRRDDDAPIGVVRGPDADQFTLSGWTTLVSESFRVSIASDRTGYRLEGPVIERAGTESGPSAPVCAGVVQVPPAGRPLVLMADAPTIGGYPVLAVVSSADIARLAQRRPGDSVQFREVTVNS
jgi:biotin-dependent carboxylase-like uncharacterized protein